MPINIRVAIGHRTIPLKIEQADPVKKIKDVIYRETGIDVEKKMLVLLSRGPLPDEEIIRDICMGGELLYLYDNCQATTSNTGKQERGTWNFENNISHSESTQVNGFVGDGQLHIPNGGGKSAFTKNESRGRSIQVNGFISNMDLLTKEGST